MGQVFKTATTNRYTRTAGVFFSLAAIAGSATGARAQEGEKEQPGFVMPTPNRGQKPS
jgi:hypothetical protein